MSVLEGIRVIDVTQFFMGPVAAAHLADMGAEVIHVEPLTGEGGRGVQLVRTCSLADWNAYFDVNNRNKRSLAVDLTKDLGKEILYKLIKKSDVFISNLSKRALSTLGLEYSTLARINQKLIYMIGSSYGCYGADADKHGWDIQGQARAGLMPFLGEPGEPPVYTGTATGDATGALITALGVMIALYSRECTGKGQECEVSLFGSQIAMEALPLQAYLSTGDNYFLRQHSRKEADNPLFNLYKTADRWVYFTMRNDQDSWSKVCKGLGMEELEHNTRFDNAEKRYQNSSLLISILDEKFAIHTAAEWFEKWKGLGLLASPVSSFEDLAIDPQAEENKYLIDAEHRVFGKVRTIGFPIQLSKTPGNVKSVGMEVGEQTEEILIELLGYDWDQIAGLKDKKVIL